MQRVSTSVGTFSRILNHGRFGAQKLQTVKPAAAVSRRTKSSLSQEPFLSGNSSNYVEEMYYAWLVDPKSVHASWNAYFTNLNKDQPSAYMSPPDLQTSLRSYQEDSKGVAATHTVPDEYIADNIKVQKLIAAYRANGHSIANLDPLGINFADLDSSIPKELTLEHYQFNDPNVTVKVAPGTLFSGAGGEYQLEYLNERLKEIYTTSIGIEYIHLRDSEQIEWLRNRFENPDLKKFSKKDKRLIIERLIRSQRFEEFLAKKYPSEKRFGLEGCEVLIPGLKVIIDKANELGANTFIFGMPHRGRLNVLANVARKPLDEIFSQFNTELSPEDEGAADVKYHLGVCQERMNHVTSKNVKIMVCANPSHLEAVCPVALGKTRAEQFYNNDKFGRETMAILIHGDAAFSGQGVVFESFHMNELPSYTTHGTIHVVVNNQIGFTTDPRFSRSSPYCTDVAKVTGAPIFHVNGDDPEAVMHCCQVAAEFRQKFGQDCVIDIVCYRKNGHNESDEPSFTQPLMYKKIRSHKPVLQLYLEKCIGEDVITDAEYQEHKAKYDQICESAHSDSLKNPVYKISSWLDSPWPNFFKSGPLVYERTGVDEATLKHVGTMLSTIKDDTFKAHSGINRTLKKRLQMVEAREIDWALGEGMAFGTLLKEGIHVRLSGQDVERGTFSHRHHVLHDANVDKKTYNQLNRLYPDQALYTVCNSSLSEFGVLGFELGYSLTNPNALVIWEAQFGDFCNGAQCIIDQFIASGETKWTRQSGLVMLLPHGMEGMGPEHSSARLERFLQLSSDDPDVFPKYAPHEFTVKQLQDINMIVANCTTPANFFHLLRRQIKLPFRKPLIVMTPKSLLRLDEAKSSFDDLVEGTKFQRLYPEIGLPKENAENVKKLIFCSGKIYYEIKKEITKSNKDYDIAVARVEQISPFPFDRVKQEVDNFPNAQVFWAQEEHKNAGAFEYVRPRFLTAMGDSKSIGYIGRKVSPSPASGSKAVHKKEHSTLMAEVVSLAALSEE